MKSLLSKDKLNKLGFDTKQMQRQCKITAGKLAISLLKSFSELKVDSLTALYREFTALFDENTQKKTFYNQLAKTTFPHFMKELVSDMLSHFVIQSIRFQDKSVFSEFGRILIQDGTSFAVHHGLHEHFPGRFKTNHKSAVELHVTYD